MCNNIAQCTVKDKKKNLSRLARGITVLIAGTNKVELDGNQILKEYALAECLNPEQEKEHVKEQQRTRKLELDGSSSP